MSIRVKMTLPPPYAKQKRKPGSSSHPKSNLKPFIPIIFSLRFIQSDLRIYSDQKKVLNYKVKGVDKIVIYWLAELINPSQDPILSDEHTAFKWLNKTETISIAGYRDFNQMLEHFDNEIKTL